MTDRIFLENLRLKCRVGVTEEERSKPQDVLLDVSIFMNLGPAGRHDDLGETVSYATILERISESVSQRKCKLLENLAEGIATLVLQNPQVDRVVVKARKAKYSSEPNIGVEIERSRPADG